MTILPRVEAAGENSWAQIRTQIRGLGKDLGFAMHSCVTGRRGKSEFLDGGRETQARILARAARQG